MKSVADLIANKQAFIKRDKRGKITAASLTAAGAAVLAAAQAEAQGLDGFEDITSSVISFERIGNGQIEFELENGQRFIANEGQYIIEGNQILVSQELVTIVGGAGLDPTVVAIAVGGAALLVGALILLNSDDDDDDDASSGSTPGTTPSVPGTTTTITPDSSGEATGTAGDDTFTVSGTDALDAISGINGGSGTDRVTLTEVLDPDTSPALDLGSRGVTLTGIEEFAVSVDASAGSAELDMSGEAAALIVTNTEDGDQPITITDLGPSAAGGSSAELSLTNFEGGQKADVDTESGVDELVVKLKNAGESDADPMVLDVADSSEPITELTVSSDGSSTNSLKITADPDLVTLNIQGTENLYIDDTVGDGAGSSDMSAVATVDASSASGKITLSVDDTVTTLTMGSGNDEVTAVSSGPASSAVWDGGTGNDTLDLGTNNTGTATIRGFETIVADANANLDFTNITDVEDLQVSGVSVTLSNLGAGDIEDQITFAESSKVIIASSATETELEFKGASGSAGIFAIENNSSALTEITYEPGTDGTLTLTGTSTKDLVLRGSEEVILTGDGIDALTTVDARSASAVTATDNAFDAIASYLGSSGKDDIAIDGVAPGAKIETRNGDDNVTFTTNASDGNSATVELGGGDDTVTLHVNMDAGAITLDGGDGKDTFDLVSGSDVAVTVEINAGDHSVETASGVLNTDDFETVENFTPVTGTGDDVIDLSSLNLDKAIVFETSGANDADGFNNAYNDILADAADVVYIDADDDGNVQYVFYDNGEGGVGVIDFGSALNLSQTDGEDFYLGL